MATFRQYNVQLLPLDTHATKEVGIEGYKRLFELLKSRTVEAYKHKRMAEEAKPLANDTFICPFVVHAETTFAYGSFLKFHKAETVTEFYSQEPMFQAPMGTTPVSNTYYFRFVFDYEIHRFAIEEQNGRLPSVDVMSNTIDHFFRNIAEQHFKKHVLTINLISDDRSLKEALDAENEFGPVHVKIAFPNSRRLNETLRELKDLSAHHVEAKVSPARGARMNGLPQYVKDLLVNAAELGEATIVFFSNRSPC